MATNICVVFGSTAGVGDYRNCNFVRHFYRRVCSCQMEMLPIILAMFVLSLMQQCFHKGHSLGFHFIWHLMSHAFSLVCVCCIDVLSGEVPRPEWRLQQGMGLLMILYVLPRMHEKKRTAYVQLPMVSTVNASPNNFVSQQIQEVLRSHRTLSLHAFIVRCKCGSLPILFGDQDDRSIRCKDFSAELNKV